MPKQLKLINPELLTAREADRRVAVGKALAQLDVVHEAFASGYLQPHMDNFRIMSGYLRRPSLTVVAPHPANSSSYLPGSFAAGFNNCYGMVAIQGYEIDAMGPETIFKVGPRFKTILDLVDIHDPALPQVAQEREEALIGEYSTDEFRDALLPLDYTASFVKLAEGTYRYAAQHLAGSK